jgi:uncharacterized protein
MKSWITPKAQKGVTSGIAGRGLVALEPIERGEVVTVKGGHIVPTAMLQSLPEHLQNSEVQITDDLHLVALTDDEYEPVMLFINHSCEPNVGFGGNIVLVAMRDIAAGEELTTDYALFDDYEGSMECNCGRSMCRRRIDGRDWQRSDLQERFRGYFSWYLERRIRGREFDHRTRHWAGIRSVRHGQWIERASLHRSRDQRSGRTHTASVVVSSPHLWKAQGLEARRVKS